MKSFVAIMLMSLLVFNWFGYRLLYDYLQQRSEMQLENLLDKQAYDEGALLTISVPLNMPYIHSQHEFQRVDGEVTIDGVLYKYVKRKVVNDTLILQCLPNETKMELAAAKNDYFKKVNDLSHPTKSHKEGTPVFKNLIDDCCLHKILWSLGVLPAASQTYAAGNENIFSYTSHHSPEQPPDFHPFTS